MSSPRAPPAFVSSESVSNGQRKRLSSGSPDRPHLQKKVCRQSDIMESQKVANFSSVAAPNGVSKQPSGLGKKQGAEKKVLAIKNFKGNSAPRLWFGGEAGLFSRPCKDSGGAALPRCWHGVQRQRQFFFLIFLPF